MKEYKTFNQQLSILRSRGLIVPKDGSPKRFLEQENYYNVINGYKDLFLKRNPSGQEQYIPNTHFNELKSLFLFDRELRLLFLKYMLIFENSFKTVLAHEFSRKYREPNAYLEIKNYVNEPKKVLDQIYRLTQKIRDKVDKDASIKHYIDNHGAVPLWVLVNHLTIGNLSYLYNILKDTDKNVIAKYYSDKYNKQYKPTTNFIYTSEYLASGLKIINLMRNKCAHEERLYNSDFGNIQVSNISNHFGMINYDNRKLVSAIMHLKILLDKNYFKVFYSEIIKLFEKYRSKFKTVTFSDILNMMGIDISDLEKLK